MRPVFPRISPRTVARRLVILAALALLAVAADTGRWLLWPDVAGLADKNPSSTAFMDFRRDRRAAQGETLRVRHAWTALSAISPNLVLAVTIAEDDAFWDHEGFDFRGMEEAMRRNLAHGEIRAGGSTITQQLAKNLWFTPERSLRRKAQEAVMAWRLERELDKRRILELYLNVVEWGDGVFGAEAAAQQHFGVPPSALTPGQAARLAAVLPSPLRWDPAGNSAVVKKRAAIILARMRRRAGWSPGH